MDKNNLLPWGHTNPELLLCSVVESFLQGGCERSELLPEEGVTHAAGHGVPNRGRERLFMLYKIILPLLHGPLSTRDLHKVWLWHLALAKEHCFGRLVQMGGDTELTGQIPSLQTEHVDLRQETHFSP